MFRLRNFLHLTNCGTATLSTVRQAIIIIVLKNSFKQPLITSSLNRMLCTNASKINTKDTFGKNSSHATDESQNSTLLSVDYSELEIDPETKKKIQVILMEQILLREEGQRAPSFITVKDMKELLTMGYNKRKSYMGYLFKNEITAIVKKRKHKERINRDNEVKKLRYELEAEHLQYGMGRNTIFMHIRPKSLHNFYMARLSHSVLYGQKLVFDLSFGKHMSKQETINAAQQLKISYSFNKKVPTPFCLHFTNVQPDNEVMEHANLAIPNLFTTSMITISGDSYLNHYPKEKLVYLTEDAPHMLQKYDHDAIYIIGVIVERGPVMPLTLAKAKREGIKVARLPIEKHLLWGLGDKTLTLNQVVEILSDVKEHNNWKKALQKGVPTRKLAKTDDERENFNYRKYQLEKKKFQLMKMDQLVKQDLKGENESAHQKLKKMDKRLNYEK